MQTTSRVLKNTGILYAKMGITMFISLYSTRLILNALGATDFGIFNIVGGAIAMLTFLNTAMAAATQRFMSFAEGAGDKNKQTKIFNISTILHFSIALIIGVGLEIAGIFLFGGILNIPETRVFAAKMIYQFMIVSTMLTIMTVPYDAVLNAHENMFYYAITGIIESFLKLTAAIVIIHTLEDKLIIYGLLIACISSIVMIMKRIYCHSKYSECVFNPRKHFDKKLMTEMATFGGWSFLGSTIGMLSNYGQGIVINIFFGTIVNAAQGVANQLSGQLGVFSGTMIKALNPAIVKSEGAGKRDNTLRATLAGSKMSYFLLSFFTIPFIIEMPFILKIWLKNPPEFAVIFCRLLLVKTMIEQLVATFPTAISATGRIKQYQICLSSLAIFPLIISYILFSYDFPAPTIYIVFIIQVSIRTFVLIPYFAYKQCELHYLSFLKGVVFKCFSVTAISVSLSLIPYCLMSASLSRLILIFSISFISFMFSFFLFGITAEEKKKLSLLVLQTTKKLKNKTLNKNG